MAITSENKKALVKFYRGNLDDYQSEQFKDVIYFAEDSHILRMNGKTYSGIIDAEYKAEEGRLKLIFDKELGGGEVVTKEIDLGAKDIQLIDYEAADRETGMGTLLKDSILEDTESVQDALALLDTALRLEIERSAQGRGNITKTLAEENERAKKAENHIYDKVLALIDAHNDTRERLERMMDRHPKVIVGNEGGETPVMSVTPNGDSVKISYDIENKKGEGTYKPGDKQEITLSAATAENAGVMVASDKKQIDEFFNGWTEKKSLGQVIEDLEGSVTNEKNRAEEQEQALQNKIEKEEKRAKQKETENYNAHQQLVNGLPQVIVSTDHENPESPLIKVSPDDVKVNLSFGTSSKKEDGTYEKDEELRNLFIPNATTFQAGVMTAKDKSTFNKFFGTGDKDNPKSLEDLEQEITDETSRATKRENELDLKLALELAEQKVQLEGVEQSIDSLPDIIASQPENGHLIKISSDDNHLNLDISVSKKKSGRYVQEAETKHVPIPPATALTAGVMTAKDKKKLDRFFGDETSDEDHKSLTELNEAIEKESERAKNRENDLSTQLVDIEFHKRAHHETLQSLPDYIAGSDENGHLMKLKPGKNDIEFEVSVKKRGTMGRYEETSEDERKTITIPHASFLGAGVMSVEDKKNLDDINESLPKTIAGYNDEGLLKLHVDTDNMKLSVNTLRRGEEGRYENVENGEEGNGGGGVIIPRATHLLPGLLSAEDKVAIDRIPKYMVGSDEESHMLVIKMDKSGATLIYPVYSKDPSEKVKIENTKIPIANKLSTGLMSSADKRKLDATPKHVIGSDESEHMLVATMDPDSVKIRYGVHGEEGGSIEITTIPAATKLSSGVMTAKDKGDLDSLQCENDDKIYGRRGNKWVPIFETQNVADLNNLPITAYSIFCNCTSSTTQSMSFNGTPKEGAEFMIDIYNGGSSDLTINLPNNENNFVSDGSQIKIGQQKYGAISARYINSKFILLGHGSE